MGRRIEQIAPAGMSFKYRMKDLLNPMNWYREFKYDHQRMTRGWSDRDSWDTGRYIVRMTADMLKKLGDEKSHIDWEHYFKTNYPHSRGYKSLADVATDLDAYLAFEDVAFTDRLDFEVKHKTIELPDGNFELTHDNNPDQERQIRRALMLHHEEEKALYEKAKNAMFFVALNFPALWD